MDDRPDKDLQGSFRIKINRHETIKETILEFEKRNTKILVVDDDEAIRSLIDDILRTQHFRTTLCASGREALDQIKREDFRVIITDIKLSDFDGMNLLRAAKVIDLSTEVIIITGYPSVETAVAAMRFGAAEYFTKPFGIEQLQKAVNRLLEKGILERKLKVEKHQMEIQRFERETGLFTNRYFHLLLSHEIRRSVRFKHSCSLLFTQINGLNSVQESEAGGIARNGDTLMHSLSRALCSSSRQIDFIARYSYDELAFILPETNHVGIEAVSRRIRERLWVLSQNIASQGISSKLEPIFGGATFPKDAANKELLISRGTKELLHRKEYSD